MRTLGLASGDTSRDHRLLVADLLSSMTWEEKLGQLRAITMPPTDDGQDFQDAAVIETLRRGRVGTVVAPRSHDEAQHFQRIAIEGSRLGIPLLFAGGLDCGDWPNPSAIAATWDTDAVEALAHKTALTAAENGITWLATPAFSPDESECDRRDAPRVLPHMLSDRIRQAMRRGIEDSTRQGVERDAPSALALMRTDDSCLAPAGLDSVGPDKPIAGMEFSRWHGLDVEALADLPLLGFNAGPKAARDVDDAVRSLLLAKARLGLFDDPLRLAPGSNAGATGVSPSASATHARSMILLANAENVLPLTPDTGSVLAIGAGHTRGQWLGDALDGAGIVHRRISGLALRDATVEDPRALMQADGLAIGIACDAASRADTVIVVLSDADCIADARFLPRPGPAAGALLGTLVNASRRCVLVSATSLPIDPTFLPVRLAAVLHAWAPSAGSEAGFTQALGAILAGGISPSGRLPWPIGPAGDPQARPCGFGLTYGEITYSRLTVKAGEDDVIAEVTISNAGEYDACETVQLYRRGPTDIDEAATAHLCDFARVTLRAGESLRFTFKLGVEQLGQTGKGSVRQISPGTHTIMIGHDRKRVLTAELSLPEGLAQRLAAPSPPRETVPFGDTRTA